MHRFGFHHAIGPYDSTTQQDLFGTVEGRYLSLNYAMVHRCGAKQKTDLIGRTAGEIYPDRLGTHFLNQDLAVIRTGKPLIDQLERHP